MRNISSLKTTPKGHHFSISKNKRKKLFAQLISYKVVCSVEKFGTFSDARTWINNLLIRYSLCEQHI